MKLDLKSDWLAGFFRWLRMVIEEADKPFSLLITVILPIIAPIIPSVITSANLQRYMEYTPLTAGTAAVAFALVGYVAMITAIGAIMNFVEQEDNRRVWLPVVITGGSYTVYVFALIMVNIVLEYNNGISGDKIAVTALMTLGLEIPAALLNGTRISVRNADEKNEKIRNEKTNERLVKYGMKHGIRYGGVTEVPNEFRNSFRSRTNRTGRKPVHQDKVFALMDEAWKQGKVLSYTEVMQSLDLPQSTASRLRTEWLMRRGVRG